MCAKSGEIKTRSSGEGLAKAEQRVATPLILTRLHWALTPRFTRVPNSAVVELKLAKVTGVICICRNDEGEEGQKSEKCDYSATAEVVGEADIRQEAERVIK